MFLTWFDSKTLNTLYVDKNLRYHWLVQAFSRTNRILNEQKSQGNIVCFRNLKQNVDDAIALFSNKDAKEIILIESFETYVKYFNNALEKLILIAPSIESVDWLIGEEEQFEFVKAFRDLLRLKNILEAFVDFSFDKLEIDEQTFEDYKSKYLDIYRKVKTDNEKEKVSILDDVDFELELLATDIINVDYILKLLWNILDSSDENYKLKLKEQVLRTISWDPKLMSKKDLIERFIEENLWNIKDSSNIEEAYNKFFSEEKVKAFKNFCNEENIDSSKFEKLLTDYLYTEKMPLKEEIAETLNYKPELLKRKTIIDRIKNKMIEFISVFES